MITPAQYKALLTLKLALAGDHDAIQLLFDQGPEPPPPPPPAPPPFEVYFETDNDLNTGSSTYAQVAEETPFVPAGEHWLSFHAQLTGSASGNSQYTGARVLVNGQEVAKANLPIKNGGGAVISWRQKLAQASDGNISIAIEARTSQGTATIDRWNYHIIEIV